ncbi:MAG: hypothetical protein U9R66_01250, partial [Thermodesulfobacteriota bacterium]|nr:hypothetical protein [Thermodesulfobacteriota bacterium]
VFGMIWFYRHLHLYVTETTFVGGTLSVWGVWKLLQSWLNWGLDTAEISLAQRFLGRPAFTEYLVFSSLLLACLYLGTSSIYLSYEGAKPGDAEFVVEVSADSNLFLKPQKVTSYQRVAGKPFFFRTRSTDLIFDITEPGGYLPKKFEESFNFKPWSNIYLRVPADFTSKTFRLIRLIPSGMILQKLPKVGDEEKNPYDLRITHHGQTYILNDFRRQAVFIGAAENDAKMVLKKQNKEKFRQVLENHLISLGIPADARKNLITIWEFGPQFLATSEFRSGDRIELELIRRGQEMPLFNGHITVPADKTLQTIFLEVSP